jgi:excisionase family DNA binding protein
MSQKTLSNFPLLLTVLEQRGMEPKGIYTNRDAAELFDVSVRTIQDWITDEKITARNLPGRGRFLSEDLEAFLAGSARKKAAK